MTVNNEITLRRYEDFLLGKSSFSIKGPSGVEKEPKGDECNIREIKAERKKQIADAKQKEALAIVQYAVKELLGWTPQDAMNSMTEEIMEQLKLDKIITYIRYPKDLSRKKDFGWMIHLAFPNETHYDVGEQVLKLYQRVKSGELKRFPKRVFEGENGAQKLAILLNDYISKNLVVKNVEELYEIFGDSARGNILMHEAKLFYSYREIYDTPLEYLHESLGKERDEFLFSYYQYMSASNEIEREKVRLKRKNNISV